MDREHYSSYVHEEVNHEVALLQMILRNPAATRQEREIAESMLGFYQDARAAEAFADALKPEPSSHTQVSRCYRKHRTTCRTLRRAA